MRDGVLRQRDGFLGRDQGLKIEAVGERMYRNYEDGIYFDESDIPRLYISGHYAAR